MAQYRYVALNREGKRIKDTLEASTLETARNSLRGFGYTILEINELGTLNKDIDLPFLGNPKSKDMAVFCRQFVSILRAGVPVSTVLSMLGQQTENKKLQTAIRAMQADVEKGTTLAAAMRRHPKIFTPMLVNMIAAGEESGNLEKSFEQMEIYFDKARKTKAAVVRASIYPCILLFVMVVVLIVMMTRIIPKFMETFEQIGTELPVPTKIVMAISYWFVDWWWLLLIVVVVLIIAGVFFGRTNKGKHVYGTITRKLPVVKLLSVRSASATFCRTLSLLLSSGINLTESLELTAGNLRNIWFREAVQTVRTLISRGWPLGNAIQSTRVFPPMVSNMVSIGEESGDLQNMLDKCADYYDDEVEQATQRLLALMEPAMLIIMAFFVLMIVLAIFLPMLNMTQAYDQYLS